MNFEKMIILRNVKYIQRFNCLVVLTWIAYGFVKPLAPKNFLSWGE
jgi:hypothetical protein